MNIEEVREYCLGLPHTTEDTPFATYPGIVAFRIAGKIFAMFDTCDIAWFVLKCDPDLAMQLRDRYSAVTPAWHMNKRYWNQIDIRSTLPDSLIKEMIDHSYRQVILKLPAKTRAALTTPRHQSTNP